MTPEQFDILITVLRDVRMAIVANALAVGILTVFLVWIGHQIKK